VPPMQTTHSISAGAAGIETPPEFKLLIAYDDFANGRYAMRFLERLVDEFGRLFSFIPRLLKFEDLMRPQVAEQVEKEAAEADMVVVAAYGEADLPTLVKDWLCKLGPRKGKDDGTLVALFSSGKEGTASHRPAQWHLRKAARRSDREFVCNPIDWPAKEATFPVEITWRINGRVNAGSRQAECPA
jgi:hypothetical protein